MKITLYIACSLDGYIAAADDDLSFLSAVEQEGEDYGYQEFTSAIDTVIMGRKTYDKVLSFGIDFPHKNKKCFVLSNSKSGSDENVTFVRGDVMKLIEMLEANGSRNVYCDGGAETVVSLLKQKLINEFVISVIPVLLGNGVRLFNGSFPEQHLRLISTKSFSKGLVQLKYEKI